jgi:hypothetical protein
VPAFSSSRACARFLPWPPAPPDLCCRPIRFWLSADPVLRFVLATGQNPVLRYVLADLPWLIFPARSPLVDFPCSFSLG